MKVYIDYAGENDIYVGVEKDGLKASFRFNPRNMKILHGYMTNGWWSWGYGAEYPGLFIARLSDLIDDPEYMEEKFSREGLDVVEFFKRNIINDVRGVFYHLFGDNMMFDYGQTYDSMIDLIKEYLFEELGCKDDEEFMRIYDNYEMDFDVDDVLDRQVEKFGRNFVEEVKVCGSLKCILEVLGKYSIDNDEMYEELMYAFEELFYDGLEKRLKEEGYEGECMNLIFY